MGKKGKSPQFWAIKQLCSTILFFSVCFKVLEIATAVIMKVKEVAEMVVIVVLVVMLATVEVTSAIEGSGAADFVYSKLW